MVLRPKSAEHIFWSVAVQNFESVQAYSGVAKGALRSLGEGTPLDLFKTAFYFLSKKNESNFGPISKTGGLNPMAFWFGLGIQSL